MINNTYFAGLEQRTAVYPANLGMQVVEFGVPTGASNTTKIVLCSSKLYALRYLIERFGVIDWQIVIQSYPDSTVYIEMQIGEDILEGLSKRN